MRKKGFALLLAVMLLGSMALTYGVSAEVVELQPDWLYTNDMSLVGTGIADAAFDTKVDGNTAKAANDEDGNAVALLEQTQPEPNNMGPSVTFLPATAVVTGEYVVFETDLKMNKMSKGYLNIFTSRNTRVLSLSIEANGQLLFNHTGTYPAPSLAVSGVVYQAGRWMNVKVVANARTHRFHLVVDGIVIARDVWFREGNYPGSNDEYAKGIFYQLGVSTQALNSSIMVDNVRVGNITQEEYQAYGQAPEHFVSENFTNMEILPATYRQTGCAGTISFRGDEDRDSVLHFEKDSSAGAADTIKLQVATGNYSTAKSHISVAIKPTDQELQIQFTDGAAGSSAKLGPHLFIRNGTMVYKTDKEYPLCGMAPNVWQYLEIFADADNQEFYARVSEEKAQGEWYGPFPFRGNPAAIAQISFFAHTGVMIDDLEVWDSYVSASTFGICESNPGEDAELPLADTKIRLRLNRIFDAASVSLDNFALKQLKADGTEAGAGPEITDLDVEADWLTLTCADTFSYETPYALTAKGLATKLGPDGEYMREQTITFRTGSKKDVLYNNPLVYVNGYLSDGIGDGTVTVKMTVRSTMSQAQPARMIVAVKSNGLLEDIACSELVTLSGGSDTFTVNVNVTDSENSTVEVFLWNGFQKSAAYLGNVVIDSNGIRS